MFEKYSFFLRIVKLYPVNSIWTLNANIESISDINYSSVKMHISSNFAHARAPPPTQRITGTSY